MAKVVVVRAVTTRELDAAAVAADAAEPVAKPMVVMARAAAATPKLSRRPRTEGRRAARGRGARDIW
jgi:hypothetical protein